MQQRVRVARETFADFIGDAASLIRRHWHEIAHYKDIPLDVDREGYQRCEDAGILRVFMARDEETGEVVGYLLYMVGMNLHYRTSRQARQDVFYVDPARRGVFLGLRLLRFADEALKAEGVQVACQHVKLEHPALATILRRAGYEPIEAMWAKRLDLPTLARGRTLGGEDANNARAAEMLSPGERADVEDEDAEHNDRRIANGV